MDISARIDRFSYQPILCNNNFNNYSSILLGLESKSAVFELDHSSGQKVIISRWVSPKRTRTYPYTRVYDSLGADPSVKKISVIPIVKDEGKAGDRDFLQFDTINLMSLIGVHVILSYYESAIRSTRADKITNQQFNHQKIVDELEKLVNYPNSVISWNKEQGQKYLDLATVAIQQYEIIGRQLGVEMHSSDKALDKLHLEFNNPGGHIDASRRNAIQAQRREKSVVHVGEKVEGSKASVTVIDPIGGVYYLTADEFEIVEENIFLIEAKHSRDKRLPGETDIKDGLFKMMLFSNIDLAVLGDIPFTPRAVLKLTSGLSYSKSDLNNKELELCDKLTEEANLNGFSVQFPEQIT